MSESEEDWDAIVVTAAQRPLWGGEIREALGGGVRVSWMVWSTGRVDVRVDGRDRVAVEELVQGLVELIVVPGLLEGAEGRGGWDVEVPDGGTRIIVRAKGQVGGRMLTPVLRSLKRFMEERGGTEKS